MPPVVPFIPLIVGGIQSGVSIWSGRSQMRAYDHAAAIQDRAAERALAFEREVFDEQRTQYYEEREQERRRYTAEFAYQKARDDFRLQQTAPYRAIGGSATSTMAELLGLPAVAAPNPAAPTLPGPPESSFNTEAAGKAQAAWNAAIAGRPFSEEAFAEAFAAFQEQFPGAKRYKGDIEVPGLGWIDTVQNYEGSDPSWQWQPKGASASSAGGPTGSMASFLDRPRAAASPSAGAPAALTSTATRVAPLQALRSAPLPDPSTLIRRRPVALRRTA